MTIRQYAGAFGFLISLSIVIYLVTKVIVVKASVVGFLLLALFLSLIAGMLQGSSAASIELLKKDKLIGKLEDELNSLKNLIPA